MAIKNKKKIIKLTFFIIILAVLVVSGIFAKNNFTNVFLKIILKMFCIVIVVCVPLIIIGYCILNNTKYKKIKISISAIITILVYSISIRYVINYAKDIILYFSEYSINEIWINSKKNEDVNLNFLEDYIQKQAKNGYLSKYDITQILNLADIKSTEISINYTDDISNINLSTTNKDDNKMKELIDSLKAEYYIYNYKKDDEEIEINIERYNVESEKKSEKNEEIVLTGEKNIDIIENTNKYYISDDYTDYLFENKIKENTAKGNNYLISFNMLLLYDKNTQNYVPIIDNKNEYDLIDSYKVYSTGISITLKDGVELKNTDYTLRLNRYDDKLNVVKNLDYYYIYEPVVTKVQDSEGRIVLEIRFNNTYTINKLQNIEIIFGN